MDDIVDHIAEAEYYTVGEVSAMCGLPTYTLRYWEKKLPQLKPKVVSANRRMYSKLDMALIRQVKKLIEEEGYTINGASKLIMSGKKQTRSIDNQGGKGSSTHIVTELEKIIELLDKD